MMQYADKINGFLPEYKDDSRFPFGYIKAFESFGKLAEIKNNFKCKRVKNTKIVSFDAGMVICLSGSVSAISMTDINVRSLLDNIRAALTRSDFRYSY